MTPSIRYSLVQRHRILLILTSIKYIFFIIPMGLIVWIFYRYHTVLPPSFSNYILLPLLLIAINYIFLQIALEGIEFYGKIILIWGNHIILLHTSCILIDDIEFIDTKSILKIDVERHGLISNIFNYGDIIIEQRNDVRRIHYVPFPHTIYHVIKEHIPTITQDPPWINESSIESSKS